MRISDWSSDVCSSDLRNIEATRDAIGLDTESIEVTRFDLNTDEEEVDLTANAESVRNIRIWDPSEEILGQTFPQLQRVRSYYTVNDVDIDRYELDGVPTQVVLSVRDLNTSGIPSDSWAPTTPTYPPLHDTHAAPPKQRQRP